MKKVIIIFIAILCITVGSIGSTYVCVNQIKQSEINDLESQYNEEKSSLNQEIENLNQQILSFQSIDLDNHRYNKQMTKAFINYGVARDNEGYAEADYDSACMYYEENYFDDAEIFADSADIHYGHASISYSDAKAFFDNAIDYATSNNTRDLATLFSELSHTEYQMASEMHEANEYFSSACHYYSNGNYGVGDNEIDKMNEHIEEHDNLIPTQNDLWSEINVLLENFN